MKKITAIAKDEQGSVLIMAILILVLLTILAFTAMRTSVIERQIAGNELLHQKYFFSAEAGVDHVVKLLEQPFVAVNAPLVRSGATASWDFAFLGADRVAGGGDDATDPDGDTIGSYEDADGNKTSAMWIDEAVIDGIRYSIYLWNNDESITGTGGTFNDDEDALVWIRSDAWGPRGGRASVQILLQGDTTGESITGYTAQAGAGAGKNYNANDLNPITSWDRQL
jgi:hypothetical protein